MTAQHDRNSGAVVQIARRAERLSPKCIRHSAIKQTILGLVLYLRVFSDRIRRLNPGVTAPAFPNGFT